MQASSYKLEFVANPGGQAAYLALPATKTYRLFTGGIGSGKTRTVAWQAAKYALTHPGSVGMLVAPTNNMMITATLPAFLQWLPDGVIARRNQNEGLIELTNGSIIWLRTAKEPEYLKGANLNWLAVDEGAVISNAAWQILKGRLRLADAVAFVASTPKGRANWLYKEFIANPSSAHAAVRAATRENAHNLRPGFIEELGYTGRYAEQELEGEFVAFEGIVYPEFDRTRNVFSTPRPAYSYYVAGIDWGYTNPGVIAPCGVTGDGAADLLEEHYQRRVFVAGEGDTWLARATDVAARYPGIVFYADPSEPGNIAAFTSEGLDVRPADNRIVTGISEVANRLATGRLRVHDSCANAIAEFEQYHYPDSNSTRNADEKPVKESDHAMDAIRYAMMGIAAPAQEIEVYI